MFVSLHSKELGVYYLCRKLKVSKSGYYTWLYRKEPRRVAETRKLQAKIEAIFHQSRETYGSPRVHEALKKEGIHVGKNRVAKIMRESGLKARAARVYKRLGCLHKYFQKFPNQRMSFAKPTGINQQWAADLTYLKVGPRKMYLAAIMDLFSRKIVGWAYGKRKDSQLTKAALMFAIRNRKPSPGLLFHTDRGTEYLCYEYQKVNVRNGIIPSMNRPGRCTDNAEIESFFHTLKGDIIKGNTFQSDEDLRKSVGGYIHHFYNRARLHSSLNYSSPVEFESRST